MLQPAPATVRALSVRAAGDANVRRPPTSPVAADQAPTLPHRAEIGDPVGSSRPRRGNLPVHPVLSSAFPGGLRRGGVYHLTGSLTVALGLLAGASEAGAWCGVVGLPDLGIEAAASWGICLERLVLLPTAGADWTGVVATLIESVDLVLTPAPARVSNGELNRLTARLRDRRATLIVLGDWAAAPRALAGVHGQTTGWSGIGDGRGYLMRRQLRLDITERHRTRSVHLELS